MKPSLPVSCKHRTLIPRSRRGLPRSHSVTTMALRMRSFQVCKSDFFGDFIRLLLLNCYVVFWWSYVLILIYDAVIMFWWKCGYDVLCCDVVMMFWVGLWCDVMFWVVMKFVMWLWYEMGVIVLFQYYSQPTQHSLSKMEEKEKHYQSSQNIIQDITTSKYP